MEHALLFASSYGVVDTTHPPGFIAIPGVVVNAQSSRTTAAGAEVARAPQWLFLQYICERRRPSGHQMVVALLQAIVDQISAANPQAKVVGLTVMPRRSPQE